MNTQHDQTMYKQYYNHANIVYASTIVAHVALFPLFISLNPPYVLLAMFFAFISSIAALYQNIKKRFALASFIYLSFLVLHATVEVMVFGLAPGFHYYYFNIATLIVFTPWKKLYKLLGVALQIVIFVGVFVSVRQTTPLYQLSTSLILFFQIINITFNIIGVSNAAYYYISIATEAEQKLALLASTDSLTQLKNRAGLWNYVNYLLPKNPLNSFGILLLDIDHFKEVNDTYGHLCGDQILIDIASILTKHLTAEGIVVRYGGEEFLLLIASDTPKELDELSKTIRHTIEMTPFRYLDTTLHVTVSIGSLFVTNKDVDFDRIFSHADALLYQAKNEGRNRVVLSTYIEEII